MENKLQELTDKLYREGLSKGKEEGEAILAKANDKSAEILEQAGREAESIVRQARKEAEDLKAKVEGDVKAAAMQALEATKRDIENLLLGKMTDKAVAQTLSSAGFVKEIVKAVAEKFNAEEPADLEVVLPESLKAELAPFIAGELAKTVQGGITAGFSKKISGGFTIGPGDGGWFISLTDETFQELIREYLRPATRKFLFGE